MSSAINNVPWAQNRLWLRITALDRTGPTDHVLPWDNTSPGVRCQEAGRNSIQVTLCPCFFPFQNFYVTRLSCHKHLCFFCWSPILGILFLSLAFFPSCQGKPGTAWSRSSWQSKSISNWSSILKKLKKHTAIFIISHKLLGLITKTSIIWVAFFCFSACLYLQKPREHVFSPLGMEARGPIPGGGW